MCRAWEALGSRITMQPRLLLRPSSERSSQLAPPCACRVASADSDLTQEELEEQLEAFMRRQAAIEGGEASRKVEPGTVLGANEVSEEVSGGACSAEWAMPVSHCWPQVGL